MHGPGTVLADRYRLEARVGSGGMGEVWRATDQVLDRTVAVKLMHPALLEEDNFAQRFRSEARAMATVDHPGVITVHDYRGDPAGAFLVMAYVDGEPLSRVLQREKRLPAPRALELVAQAAEALHAAHERGIVHRDVKPANLLLRRDGTLVLTDFGIARTGSGTQLTATGAVPRTLAYLAPEQVLGHPATPLSDVYALGVVAYEALAGMAPFIRENAFAGAMARVQQPPPALPADIPAPVAAIVHQALATDPAHRWPSAAALAAACRQAAASTGTPAAPPAGFAAPGPPPAATATTVDTGSVHSAPTWLPPGPAWSPPPPGPPQPPTHPPSGRWVAVGVLALTGAVVRGVLVLMSGNATAWVDNAAPVAVVLVAAILLLATRRPAWAGLLAGVLAWEWFYFAYWTVIPQTPDGSWVWTPRGVFGIATNLIFLLCILLIGVLFFRGRVGRPALAYQVVAVAGLFAAKTTFLAAGSLPGDLIDYLFQAVSPRPLLLLLTVAAVMLGCTAVLPVVLSTAPRDQTVRLVALGWFLGGLQLALSRAFGWLSYEFWESAPLGAGFWLLLLATVATALVAHMSPATRSEG